VLLLDVLQHSEGMTVRLSNNQSATTTSGSRSKLPAPAFPRSSASFALMETMTKNNQQKQEIALRMLENNRGFLALEDRDRAFARLLLSTTERRLGQIDKVIGAFVKKPLSKGRQSDVLCQAVLRVGAAQLLFMDVPHYAAVSETVEVLRQHPRIKVSKTQISFVNAVLRSIAREGMKILNDTTTVLDNISPWLASEWIKTYGRSTTENMVEAAMNQSPIFVSVNQLRVDINFVEDAFSAAANDDDVSTSSQPEVLPSIGSIRVPENMWGMVSKWPLYHEGVWWVQDPSATLPAIALESILRNIEKTLQETHVVDLCSAPGGKTAQLCSMGFGHVHAVEISKARTKSLQQNLERLGMQDKCTVSVEDGRMWMPSDGEIVDAVLLDAPCSATGVGSRRPDVLRKLSSAEDIAELVTMQQELMLHTVDDILQHNGLMVYATCSLLPQEGEDQIEWLLNCRKDAVEMVPFDKDELTGFDKCVDEEHGWLRVLPGVLDGSFQYCDGFFVARIRKTI
jgi:16S rRNA (cytosine967-C5)-methyltransferase